MQAPRQIISLVTFFEISQRKSLGCRASPAVLSLDGFSGTKVKTDSSRTVRRHPFCPGGNKKDAKNAYLLAACRTINELAANSPVWTISQLLFDQ